MIQTDILNVPVLFGIIHPKIIFPKRIFHDFNDKQLEYIHKLEENFTKRIEKILIPIMGKANVRAQVTADVDFSRIERAEETYKPNNQKTETASIRSQQTVESTSVGSNFDGGIPGALSNQPPEPAHRIPTRRIDRVGSARPVVPVPAFSVCPGVEPPDPS